MIDLEQVSEKSNIDHTHTANEIGGFVNYNDTALRNLIDTKANENHTHEISDITNLQNELDGKSNTNHTHSNYASTSHSHSDKMTFNNYGDQKPANVFSSMPSNSIGYFVNSNEGYTTTVLFKESDTRAFAIEATKWDNSYIYFYFIGNDGKIDGIRKIKCEK